MQTDLNILIAGDGPAAMLAGLGIKTHAPGWSVTLRASPAQPLLPVQILANPVVTEFTLASSAARQAVRRILHRTTGIAVMRGDSAKAPVTIPGLAYSSAGYGELASALRPLATDAGCRFVDQPVDPGNYDLVLISSIQALQELDPDCRMFPGQASRADRSAASFATVGGPDAITFSLVDTPHGPFHAIFIPAQDGHGSLTIEADTAAIAATGLDGPAPGDIEKLIAPCAAALPGLRISGECRWQPLQADSVAERLCGKYVLFGSAATTVHHSIGLQARHDFEEAEALSRALTQKNGTIGENLQAWQEAGKRRSASYQRAAAASAQWLANAPAWRGLTEEQFAFACATRSFRMGYKRIQDAAPEFTRGLDAWTAGPSAPAQNRPPPPMFTPYAMRGLDLPNRMVFSPMCMYSAIDGTVNDFHNAHLGARAVGGFGLVIAEMTNVTAQGRMTPGCAGMYAPEHVPAWQRATAFVHEHTQSKIGIQLAHAGRKGSIGRSWEKYDPVNGEDMWEVIAPSAIPFTPDRPVPREMTRADIADTVEAFAKAARMSVEAGFDMIELHMAHGYLISEFISPLANKRGDAYGGSLANRMRFPLEVFEAVRAQIPDGMPIAARISADDFDPEGVTPHESIEISRMLRQAGVDIIAVSTAGVTSARRPVASQRLYQLALCEAIRHEAGTPAMTVGGLVSHTDCNMIIASGRADLCVMARGAMNEPYFPHHAANEQGYRFDWPLPYARADETVIRAS